MRAQRIAGTALTFAILFGAAFLAASWLADHRAAPSAAPNASGPLAAEVVVASGAGERSAIEPAADAEIGALALDEAQAPTASRVGPDVDTLVRELVSLLESPDLKVESYLEGWLAGQANDLDAPCARILEAIAQEPGRKPVESIAALLLLSECAERFQVADLVATQRSLLWQAYDVQQASPVIPTDGDADVLTGHRNEIALVAGICLAVLGDRSDLAQLVERLDRTRGNAPGLAAKSLAHARSGEFAELLLARLGDPSLPTEQMVRAVAGLARHPEALHAHPELLARASRALAERWGAEAADFMEIRSIDRLLTTLDPELRATCWGEALDRGTAGNNLYFAAEALVDHAAPRDLERIDGLLKRGTEEERLAAARAVVAVHDADSPDMLAESACGALAELVRTSSIPSVRRQALLAARKAPDRLAPVAIEALKDEDAGVRQCAAIALGDLANLDPDTRTRLEQVASTDADKRVRKAAEQALR